MKKLFICHLSPCCLMKALSRVDGSRPHKAVHHICKIYVLLTAYGTRFSQADLLPLMGLISFILSLMLTQNSFQYGYGSLDLTINLSFHMN